MSVFSRYGSVLGVPHAKSALTASIVGRLALGITGLSVLLLVLESTGSYAAAGAASAAFALSFAASAPARARQADRNGPVRVLVLCGSLAPLAALLLVGLASVDAPAPLLVLPAALVGATVPPVGAVMRALWSDLAPGPALVVAYSLESVVIELCFVLGPLVVAGLTATLGPSAAVLTAAACSAVGSLWLATNPATRAVVPHPDRVSSFAGPLASPAVRSLLVTVLFVGVGFGAVEVALPAWVEEQGNEPSSAGVLLAVFSVGSILGGLVYGGLQLKTSHRRQLPFLVTALAVGTALPLLATTPIVMGLLLVGYGLTIAPYSTCNSVLLGAAAPAGTVTEAFAWGASMIFGGVALGSGLAGVLVERYDADAALLVVAATGVLALLASLRTLAVPAPEPAGT